MNLKELRENSKLTQKQVSILTGISIRHISYIENGQRTPKEEIIDKLAKLYKVKKEIIFLACMRTKCSCRKEN